MKEFLTANGWVMFHKCNCGGGVQYWRNKDKPGYEVRTKPKSRTFRILLQNKTISGPHAEYQLEDKLRQYVN
jgi:hypothetical protein